jgi:phage/plasmid-like protein (TIGR03299 family)
MAHNLASVNGKTSFAAVGEIAWHGLGQYVEEAMTAEQAIELGGLDYTVVKKPIQVCGGVKIPDMFATVRTDINVPLGIVGDKYEIIQNREAFSFFDTIIESGEAIYQTAGALGKGEKIFITAKLPKDIIVNGEEQINNYLLLTSGHDGRSSIQCGFTSIRVVCNNTLTAALKGLQNKVTVLHYQNAKEKLKIAAQIMGITSKYTQELDQVFNKMATVKITDAKLRLFIEEVMNPAKKQVLTSDELKEYSTMFTNKVDAIMDFAHEHSTQNTDAAKGTLWGAYNAISGHFGYQKNYESNEQKMQDLYFNGGAKRIEKAFNLALSMM